MLRPTQVGLVNVIFHMLSIYFFHKMDSKSLNHQRDNEHPYNYPNLQHVKFVQIPNKYKK